MNSSQNTDHISPELSLKNDRIEVLEVDRTTDIPMTLRASSRYKQRVQCNRPSKLSVANVSQFDRSDDKITDSSNSQNCRRENSVRHRERESERLKNKTHQALNLTDGDVQTSCGRVTGQREISSEASVLGGRGRKKVGAEAKTWQVICNSYNDWKLLTEKLSRNEKKCEADLVELLEQNFLMIIRGIFMEKVSGISHGVQRLLCTYGAKYMVVLTALST